MKKFAMLLLVGVIGGITAAAIFKFTDRNEQKNFEEKQALAFASLPPAADVPVGLDFIQASALATPAVVHIKTTITAQGRDPMMDFFDLFGGGRGDMGMMPQGGSGSGVIISGDGYIATNNHVIEGATRIEVVLSDRRTYEGELIGRDPSTDLALIKIEEKNLNFLTFGNSDELKVGEWVLAVGNPFNLTSTVTAGIVSAKGRNINLLYDQNNQYAIENFIQTDAAVNPGNSGGALVNTRGQLVGINTAIATKTGSYSGYSFAVPVNIVKKVMDDLLKFGEVQRGFIGVQIRDVDAKLANEYKLGKVRGVLIAELTPDGAAGKAGLEKGDVILAVNGVEVNSASGLQEQVSRFYPGDDIKVLVWRNGGEREFTVKLKGKDGRMEVSKAPAKGEKSTAGVVLKNLSNEQRAKYGVAHGAAITKVEKGPFREAGVPEGFIITKINKKPVYSAQETEALLKGADGGILIEGLNPDGSFGVFGLNIAK